MMAEPRAQTVTLKRALRKGYGQLGGNWMLRTTFADGAPSFIAAQKEVCERGVVADCLSDTIIVLALSQSSVSKWAHLQI
jgi:hypothetical protein